VATQVQSVAQSDCHALSPCEPNLLVFKVDFSDKPQLQVTYLTSYEGMGSANMSLYREGEGGEQVANLSVDGRTSNKFSIPYTSIWVDASSMSHWNKQPHVQVMPNGIKQGTYLLKVRPSFEATGGKFKLLGVSSC
jgi:hypothetical protein